MIYGLLTSKLLLLCICFLIAVPDFMMVCQCLCCVALLCLSPYDNEHTSYDPVLEHSFISLSICMQSCSGLHFDASSQ